MVFAVIVTIVAVVMKTLLSPVFPILFFSKHYPSVSCWQARYNKSLSPPYFPNCKIMWIKLEADMQQCGFLQIFFTQQILKHQYPC